MQNNRKQTDTCHEHSFKPYQPKRGIMQPRVTLSSSVMFQRVFSKEVTRQGYIASVLQQLTGMQHRWNDTDERTDELLGENPVPVPLRPLQTPRGVAWNRTGPPR